MSIKFTINFPAQSPQLMKNPIHIIALEILIAIISLFIGHQTLEHLKILITPIQGIHMSIMTMTNIILHIPTILSQSIALIQHTAPTLNIEINIENHAWG